MADDAKRQLEKARDPEQHRAFMQALLRDVAALERMLEDGAFESGITRVGAEQEMFLIDRDWSPTNGVQPLLAALDDPHFTTELGRFQMEANCDPQLLAGDGLGVMHRQLDQLVDKARTTARELDMDIVLTGMLPTLGAGHLGLDSMVPDPRYQTLNKVITDLRGGRFRVWIKGLDEVILEHDSVMLEACTASFQVHMQIAPDDFARMYNIAQLLTGPVMAVAANSPIAFGRRLWAETRIALFRDAVDTRTRPHSVRNTEARVNFGTRWVRESIAEIYKEDIARFRALVVPTARDEDPMAVLDRGERPAMRALRLHNGTIYRWNRPCFGTTNGVPHLRIENRILPAGPTTIDEMANAAFWIGLMTEYGASKGDITRRIDFDMTANNFYTAAREGVGAWLTWLDGVEISARELVLDRLLPDAEAGLRRAGVDDRLVRRYLEVIDERVRTARTGAHWQRTSWNSLRGRGSAAERSNALVAATVSRQRAGRPVAQWTRARLDEAHSTGNSCSRVEHIMRTDLFTVQADDPAEILAHLMIWERIGVVPVEDDDHHLLGLVTNREVLQALTKSGSTEGVSVGDLMLTGREVRTVSPATSTFDAVRMMRRYRLSALPVVDDERRLVGLVTKEEFLHVAGLLLGDHEHDDDDDA